MEIDDPPEVRHVTDISADRFVFSSISFLAAVIYHMNDMLLQPELQRIYWLYGGCQQPGSCTLLESRDYAPIREMQDEGKLMLAGDLAYYVP
ncbi:hypothetical protein DCAR_0205660 [Daucus carota subsp. sativus]|uniref:Uncharacterized protein n=1 Tax=Daucus carota subsp. sativus TaxID=79200 RepID=A0A166CRQ4_DAUCS|nr:hypothetical protein DCAR_0205660 [Daucus carota subsp. sativus]